MVPFPPFAASIAGLLKAAALLAAEGMRPIILQMHTVKPLDAAALDSLAERAAALIVVEEHVPAGGLWAAVAAWRAERENAPRLIRLGPPDAFALGNLRQAELRRRLHLDAASIAAACRSAWRESRGNR